MTSSETSPYHLNENVPSSEVERLNFNHVHVITPMSGGHFPPPIEAHLGALESPRIADIATGTAIWLADVAGRLPPTAVLDGYDIDSAKFPPAADLPGNVALHHGDILAPFPLEIQGTYDVVHVRLVIYLLKKHEWEPAARNLATLLKPGGWLLWEETSFSGLAALPPSQSWHDFMVYDLASRVSFGADLTVPSRLLPNMQDAGFVACSRQIFSSLNGSEELSANTTKSLLMVLRQALTGIVKRGGYDGMRTEEDISRLEAGVKQDVANGTVLVAQLWWTWGQKPL